MIELLLDAFPKHYKSTKRFTESQIHHTTLNLDSFELNDINPVTEMNNAFNRFCEIVPALKTEGMLPYGFEFQQRKYPQPFDL